MGAGGRLLLPGYTNKYRSLVYERVSELFIRAKIPN